MAQRTTYGIRAGTTGLPVTTIAQKEATVLAVAMAGFVGVGVFKSLAEAQEMVDFNEVSFEPGAASQLYQELFQRYLEVPQALQKFYLTK